MNKKVVKMLFILVLVVITVSAFAIPVFADLVDPTMPDITFESNDKETGKVVNGVMATIISVVQIVGMAIAIIMLVVMAIKYVSAAPSDKAEIKKSAMVYMVGAIVLFAASGILQVVKNFANANINNVSSVSVVEMVDDTYLG